MEHILPSAYNPQIQRVLKSFQAAAMSSLRGPSGYNSWGDGAGKMSPRELEEYHNMQKAALSAATVVKKEDDIKHYDHTQMLPPPFPVQQMPFFMPMDQRSEKAETLLEGKTISCFVVGGERRLCLPQILREVLSNFNMEQVYEACNDLHIFFSRCNAEQLETLKRCGVLPPSAGACGLITKTDAERLCSRLLYANPDKARDPPSRNSFKVYHECFGKCKGLFNPDLYTSPQAQCIQCSDCCGMFSPQKFVCHSHKSLENRTCHWGFDSEKWRVYLLLTKDQERKDLVQPLLDDLKSRFDPNASRYKRKESPDGNKDSEGKKARLDDNGAAKHLDWVAIENGQPLPSAFRPWSPSALNLSKNEKELSPGLPPFLHTGPPVLLNPENVVPFTDQQRYERHFAPNVTLKPRVKNEDYENEDVCEDTGKMLEKEEEVSVSLSYKDQTEIDVSSSDTESVSSQRLVEECVSQYQLIHEQQVSMLRLALDGKVGTSESDKDTFIKEFVKLTLKEGEHIENLESQRKNLLQEIEYLKQKHQREMEELKDRLSNHQGVDRDTKISSLREELAQVKQRLESVTSASSTVWADSNKEAATKEKDLSEIKSSVKRLDDVISQLRFRRDAEETGKQEPVRIKTEPTDIAAPPPPKKKLVVMEESRNIISTSNSSRSLKDRILTANTEHKPSCT